MKEGAYRCYFHIGNIGFKFPRFRFGYSANPGLNWLAGFICNILEYKRYRYYVLRKPYKQWGKVWRYCEGKQICPTETPALAKIYWSCGLFSIVKHYKTGPDDAWWVRSMPKYPGDKCTKSAYNKYKKLEAEWAENLKRKTAYLCIIDYGKYENWKFDDNGKLVCIDYGEFTLSAFTRTTLSGIDYQ